MSNKEKENSYISIKIEMLHKLLLDVGKVEFSVLLIISSFADEFGESKVSQRKIAEISGLSLPSINKAVNNLLKKKVDGKHVVKRKLINISERKTYSIYKLNNNCIQLYISE